MNHLTRSGRGVIAASLVLMALATGVVAGASTDCQWQPLSL
jgi:hypothetical protein